MSFVCSFLSGTEAGPLVGLGVALVGMSVSSTVIMPAAVLGAIVTGGISLIAGAGVAGGVAAGMNAGANAQKEKDQKSAASLSSASLASVASSASVGDAIYHSAVASAKSLAEFAYDTIHDPFTFGSKTKRSEPTAVPGHLLTTRDAAALISVNATGWPIAPPGVPQFNLDECVRDIQNLLASGNSITMFQPDNEPILTASNIPPRCMNLVGLLAKPAAGMFISVEGTSSIKWNNLPPDQVRDVRAFFKSKM